MSRSQVNVRLGDGLLVEVDAAAGRRGWSRSRWVTEAVLVALVREREGSVPEVRSTSVEPRPKAVVSVESVGGGCSHPKAKLRRFSWGTLCECGVRVR